MKRLFSEITERDTTVASELHRRAQLALVDLIKEHQEYSLRDVEQVLQGGGGLPLRRAAAPQGDDPLEGAGIITRGPSTGLHVIPYAYQPTQE